MGLSLVIDDVCLQVLVCCSVEVLDEVVRVELEWLELVVHDVRALLELWVVLGLARYWVFLTLVAHCLFWIREWEDEDLSFFQKIWGNGFDKTLVS